MAVCDKDLPRARTFGERYGAARCYESLEQMLGDGESELDVVHVLLPPDLHARAASALIDAGLHVFLEKPMATDAQECASLVEQAAKRGVTIGVNHNFLFAPVYEDLRRDLIAGKLGRPDHVTITWNRELDQVRSGPFNLWMLREPANIMLEIGPHCLAPILDLIGSPKLAGAARPHRWTCRGVADFTAAGMPRPRPARPRSPCSSRSHPASRSRRSTSGGRWGRHGRPGT